MGTNFTDKDFELFSKIVKLPQTNLIKALGSTLKSFNYNPKVTNKYIYAEGDIPVALIAHLDTVFHFSPVDIYHDQEKNIYWCAQGLGADDRAGVFAILKIIQSGLKPHIIFTTGEETGGIGAQLIAALPCPFKECNFIIELDRQGEDDCVFYNCNNKPFVEFIESFGFQEQLGTFTDISIICPSWGIAGTNLSVGYKNEHSVAETLNSDLLYQTINKVISILTLKYIPSFDYIPYNYKKCSDDYYYNLYTSEKHQCFKCKKEFDEDMMFPVIMPDTSISWICTDCLDDKIEWCVRCGETYMPTENSNGLCARCERNMDDDIRRIKKFNYDFGQGSY